MRTLPVPPAAAVGQTIEHYGLSLYQWITVSRCTVTLDDRQLGYLAAALDRAVRYHWTHLDAAAGTALYDDLAYWQTEVQRAQDRRRALDAAPPAAAELASTSTGGARPGGGYRVPVDRPDPVRPAPAAAVSIQF